jgi:hypothetical protein
MDARSEARLALLGLIFAAGTAEAQQGITVQLPTFHFFSVATTVSVPDSGGAYMGGVGRGSSGRNRIGGPFGYGSTGVGGQRHAAGVNVQAQIHDLPAMDKALRGGTAAAGAPPGPLSQKLAATQGDNPSMPSASLKDLDRQRGAAADAQQAEAADFLRRAREAQAAGKTALAKTYYEMAHRRATGELRDQIAAQLQAIAATQRQAARPDQR